MLIYIKGGRGRGLGAVDDDDDDDIYRCSPWAFSATCCSRGRTESMYKAPQAAAIRLMRDLGPCRDKITGHNTGISLLLPTSALVLFSSPIERRETRPTT